MPSLFYTNFSHILVSKYRQNLRPLRLQEFHIIFIQVTSGVPTSAGTECPALWQQGAHILIHTFYHSTRCHKDEAIKPCFCHQTVSSNIEQNFFNILYLAKQSAKVYFPNL